MLKPGVRVVRGPNWSWGNQDGGEGYVGTLAQIGTSESDKTVVIQWDNGSRSICRVGYLDKYDLRVLDNAQIGVFHKRITCDGCDTQKIPGLRYKCLNCYDYDLCYKCYHGDKHDLRHSFRLYETNESLGINLPPRLSARNCQLKGIFVGAKVIRGFDWEWGNQDGGEGKFGTVQDIRSLKPKSRRSTASVKWDKTNTEIYRVGHNGLCDIQFVEAAFGGNYYPDHLPVLGQSEEQMEFNQIIENIELQQVMEMESNEKTESPAKMEESNKNEQKESALISPDSAYASITKRYVVYSLYERERPNLVEDFFSASRNFTDEAVKEMWEILKYLAEAPLNSDCTCCDIIETRNHALFIWKSVELGKKYLEKRYRDYMMYVVNGDSTETAPAKINTYELVHDFVGLQFREEYVGLANETLDNRPLWPMVYYCIRAGGFLAAAKCLRKLNLPQYDHVVSLLELHGQASNSPDIDILEEKMKFSYKTEVRDVSDPFQRIVWAILGCVDDISEVARTVDDYLWFKLSLIRVDRDTDKVKYKDFQCQLLEDEGEKHHDAFKQPLVYFKLLALTGQFEAAMDFLFRTDKFRVDAVHMAIALYESNLLACPKDTNSPLLSVSPADCKPARRLNFALLIKSFLSKFETDRLEDTLHYLYLLRNIKSCEEGPNLFELGVADLVISTKEYEKILGRFGKNGVRDQGLLDHLNIDCQIFAEDLAQSLVSKERYEEAIALYDGINDQNGMLWVMCRVLAKVAHLENSPGSLRNIFQEKANLLHERFFREGFCSAHIDIINSFIKLKGLLTFFDLYRERQYPEALKTLSELKIVPLKLNELEERLKNFKNFVEDVGKVMPYALLATMTILGAQSDRIKSTEGPMEQHLHCVWEQANCVTNFAERLPNVVPKDTRSRLVQMEILMHY